MLRNGPILLLLANNQPDDEECAVSPDHWWGGGYCDNITPFSIFISIIPICSALLRHLGSALLINVFLLGSAARI
jgi:hypothetical protein